MPPSEEAGDGQVEMGAGIRRSPSWQFGVIKQRSGSEMTTSSRSISEVLWMHLAISFSVSRKTGLSGGELVSWCPLSILGVATYNMSKYFDTTKLNSMWNNHNKNSRRINLNKNSRRINLNKNSRRINHITKILEEFSTKILITQIIKSLNIWSPTLNTLPSCSVVDIWLEQERLEQSSLISSIPL